MNIPRGISSTVKQTGEVVESAHVATALCRREKTPETPRPAFGRRADLRRGRQSEAATRLFAANEKRVAFPAHEKLLAG
jgi:hypothetical protein